MTTPLFLAPPEVVAGAAVGGRVSLSGAEARHAGAARRLRPGERVDVGDGSGTVAECVVRALGRDAVEFDVVGVRVEPEPALRIVVAQALIKGERAGLAVELMTEVGVDAVVPWSARRCVTRWDGERAVRGVGRLATAAREAAKQARRAWVPRVAELADLDEVIELARGSELAVVLHEGASAALAAATLPAAGRLLLVVGPEGGLTDDEVGAFGAAGAEVRTLGPTVLRASTAGAVAVALARQKSREINSIETPSGLVHRL